MSVGVAGSKVLILVGAGVTGSVILNNPYVSEVFKDVARVLIRHLKDSGREGSSEDGAQGSDSTTAALTAQVRRLSQELRQLATIQHRPVVISHDSGRGSGVLSLILPAAMLGAVGYGYCWWKGIRFSDLMYVTRRGMNQAVESFNKQMDTLNTAISNAKRQLTGRIDTVSKTLTDSVQVQLAIKKDVASVHKAVSSIDGEMKTLRTDVQSLEGKIDEIQHTSIVAAQGVLLLCQFVGQRMEGNSITNRQEMERLSRFSSSVATARLVSSPSGAYDPSLAGALEGLKELKAIESELSQAGPLSAVPSESQSQARHMIGLGGLGDAEGVLSRGGAGMSAPLVHRSASNSRMAAAASAVRRLDAAPDRAALDRGGARISEVPSYDDAESSRNHSDSTSYSQAGQENGVWTSPMTPRGRQQQQFHSGMNGTQAPTPAPAPTPAAGSSTFTEEDLSYPPRRTNATPGLTQSRSQRAMPPVNLNFNL